MPGRRRQRSAEVVSLHRIRVERQVRQWRERIHQALDTNRRALARFFSTGALFTEPGTRAGRDLLLAHQHLLRVLRLLDKLAASDAMPAARRERQLDALYEQLDQLLERTSALTHRTGHYLATLRRD